MVDQTGLTTPAQGLNIIYARSENFCIGNQGGLPWSLPKEYQHFEKVTRGYPVITGRKSYEDHDGLLPNSLNIIVSRQRDLKIESGGLLAEGLEQALKLARQHSDQYFVIGGVGLIGRAFPLASCVFETVVVTEIDGDTFVDQFDFSEWRTRSIFTRHPDAEHKYAFSALRHDKL